MKFKSIFLGMLGMAAIVSCNNESVIDGPSITDDGNVVEGKPVYATMTIGYGAANASKASTYAGTEEVLASTAEKTVKDAAVYIYRRDASGTTPQCAVYIAAMNGAGTNGENQTVTLRTTSGSKKIFVAVNPKSNPTSLSMTDITTPPALSAVSDTLRKTYAQLNNILYSSSATAFSLTAPTTPLWDAWADGLIKNFAMNDIYGNGGGTYTSTTSAPFMSNWDGAVDAADGTAGTPPSINHTSGADFTLVSDVDSVASRPTGTYPGLTFTPAKNQLEIYVQRAYSKVSLKFNMTATTATAPTTPSGLVGKWYAAAVGENGEGHFFPWGTGTNPVWSLGNIPTAELPFQQYVSGIVQDMWYTETTDSIHQATNWHLHYDNTRVFPFSSTIQTYPNPAITVALTKGTMNALGNNTTFTADNEASESNYKYAYTTENARLDPVCHDHGTFVIVGGFYQPKNVLTSINRANVSTNQPVLGFNGAVLTGTELPGTSVGLTSPYTWTAATGDTLYYVADDKIFIDGKDNLMAYYAWASSQAKNASAGDTWLAAHPGQVITASAIYNDTPGGASFGTTVANFINQEIDDDILYAYFEGQCFYRIFIENPNASSSDRYAVLRNHIYDLSITSIKGPGIDDPNKILVPNQPIGEQTTYVSTTIRILDWHKVDQDKDVDNQ